MSTRAMARMYDGSPSVHGGSHGESDIFGNKSRNRVKEHQAFSDIDLAAATKLGEQDTANEIKKAENTHNLAIAKLVGLMAKDGNFDKLDEATKSSVLELARLNAESSKNRAKTDNEYSLSTTGQENQKKGLAANDLKQVFANQKEGTVTTPPGGITRIPQGTNPEEVLSTGIGSSLTGTSYGMHIGPDNKLVYGPEKTQTETPGYFKSPVGKIDLSQGQGLLPDTGIPQQMETGQPAMNQVLTNALQTMPQNNTPSPSNVFDPNNRNPLDIIELLKKIGGFMGNQPSNKMGYFGGQ